MCKIIVLISGSAFEIILQVIQSAPGAVSLFLCNAISNTCIVNGILEEVCVSMASSITSCLESNFSDRSTLWGSWVVAPDGAPLSSVAPLDHKIRRRGTQH